MPFDFFTYSCSLLSQCLTEVVEGDWSVALQRDPDSGRRQASPGPSGALGSSNDDVKVARCHSKEVYQAGEPFAHARITNVSMYKNGCAQKMCQPDVM